MPEVSLRQLGTTRQGRPIFGHRLGTGRRQVSLIAGCHADEPVGPAMLERLVSWLARQDPSAPCLRQWTWSIVPHVHPDGEARNRPWTEDAFDVAGGRLNADIDLLSYLQHVVRDPPGDDVEFGFPAADQDSAHHDSVDDSSAIRPECQAVADFLAPVGPIGLHASFHGMAFAAGPWFLMEHSWADRTGAMRQHLRRRVSDLGYVLHDVDRGGDKGFFRIDEGFTSRPDSKAMRAHFEALGDPATAALFRPSSMEWVVARGGDPLTLVSEMPLFLAPAHLYRGPDKVRPPALTALRARAGDATQSRRAWLEEVERLGILAMPLGDQMRLQLEFLAAGLRAVQAYDATLRSAKT